MNGTRDDIVNALVQLGFAKDSIPPDVPDAFLQAMLTFAQGLISNAQSQGNVDKAFADVSTMPAAVANGDSVQMGTDPNAPAMKFADRASAQGMARWMNGVLGQLKTTTAAAAVLTTQNANAALETKRVKIRAFCHAMTGGDAGGGGTAYMTKAQADALVPMLEKLDDSRARKFAQGDKTGTELEEQFEAIRKSHTVPVRRFSSELLPDPQRTGPVVREPSVNSGAGAGSNADIARRAMGLKPKAVAK